MKFYKNMIENSQINNENIRKIGFPRSEHMSNKAKLKTRFFIEFVRQNVVDMDDPSVPQAIKDNIEFVVDITESDSDRLTIDVKRNETRCNELKEIRQKVLEEDKLSGIQRIDKNVLILFFDNVSRVNFHRKLKKVVKFFNEISEGEDSEYDAFEFFRYHTIGGTTYISKNGMFHATSELLDTDINNVFKDFSKNGYITGFFIDQ